MLRAKIEVPRQSSRPPRTELCTLSEGVQSSLSGLRGVAEGPSLLGLASEPPSEVPEAAVRRGCTAAQGAAEKAAGCCWLPCAQGCSRALGEPPTSGAEAGAAPPCRPCMPASSAASIVSQPLRPAARQPPLSWDVPGKSTGVGGHFLLQGIFPTAGLNRHRLHCRQILYLLNHLQRLGLKKAAPCCQPARPATPLQTPARRTPGPGPN